MTPDPSKSPALFLQLEYDKDRASGDVAEAAFAELYGGTYGNATDAECDDYARAELAAEIAKAEARGGAKALDNMAKEWIRARSGLWGTDQIVSNLNTQAAALRGSNP